MKLPADAELISQGAEAVPSLVLQIAIIIHPVSLHLSYCALGPWFQRVYRTAFEGKRSVMKLRFPKKYRHPDLDEKLTKKRTQQVMSLAGALSSSSRNP